MALVVLTISMASVTAGSAAASSAVSWCISRRHFFAFPLVVRFFQTSSDCNVLSSCSSSELSIQSIRKNRFLEHNTEQSGKRGSSAVYFALAERDDRLSSQDYTPDDVHRGFTRPESGFTKKKKSSRNRHSNFDDRRSSKYSNTAGKYYRDIISPQRLSKVLAISGVASRRSCEELIFSGQVTVNGSICNVPQTMVHCKKDVIFVNGDRISKELPPKVYLALNKPKGYICSSGKKEYKSVISLFDEYLKSLEVGRGVSQPRVFTAGRLDVATTGLIIVTNDGEFAQILTHPSSEVLKEYIATIDGAVHKRHIRAVCDGAVVDGVHCIPHLVELLPKQPDILRPRLRISVNEGRSHEVREIVNNAGLKITSLRRVRIGSYRLPLNLPVAAFVPLARADLDALVKNEVVE